MVKSSPAPEIVFRDSVFVAGGQPSVTYVQREDAHVERNLERALATPNQIVSLSAPTKTGKTVLCRRVLGAREYVWIDGGQVSNIADFWNRICIELSIPAVTEVTTETQISGQAGLNIHLLSASGSSLKRRATKNSPRIDSMASAISFLIQEAIVLVIDDFHYLAPDLRVEIMRNVKGAVFNGLRVLLLSVTHRTFDAIKAESELTGRFSATTLPSWSEADLARIPALGFEALKTHCPQAIIDVLCKESQENPFLMQRFCWELCFDCQIEKTSFMPVQKIDANYDLDKMFNRLSKDAGLPVYERLVAGPQSRKSRYKRPLVSGKDADIYEATLLALAETGPRAIVSYDDLRDKMNSLLTDMMPQKHEITSALKHLASISAKAGTEPAIDWDEDKREIAIVDPYLRFFLRWQVRTHKTKE